MWYTDFSHMGLYKRKTQRIGVKAIKRLLGEYNLAIDSLRWESIPSEHYDSAPWADETYGKGADCIYFIHALGTNRLKIGWASDLPIRFHWLSCASPFPLLLICTIPGTRSDEADMHKRFSHLRVHNEWFIYSNELKEFTDNVKTRAKFA